jgi:hypothetical protein
MPQDPYVSEYPEDDVLGKDQVWHLPLNHRGELTVNGRFMGWAQTKAAVHNHPGDVVQDDRRCPSCRWFEPRLFHDRDNSRYVLYTIGCTDVPGETDRIRYRYAHDLEEAIFTMSVPWEGRGGEPGDRFLSAPARQMFEQAAQYEPKITDLLRNYRSAGTTTRQEWLR